MFKLTALALVVLAAAVRVAPTPADVDGHRGNKSTTSAPLPHAAARERRSECSTGETCSWSNCGCGRCETSGWNTCYATCGSCGTRSSSSYSNSRYRSDDDDDDDDETDDDLYGESTSGVCKCSRPNGEKCDVEVPAGIKALIGLTFCGLAGCCLLCCGMVCGDGDEEDQKGGVAMSGGGIWFGVEFLDVLTSWIVYHHAKDSGCSDDAFVERFYAFCWLAQIFLILGICSKLRLVAAVGGEMDEEVASCGRIAGMCLGFLTLTLSDVPLLIMTAEYNSNMEDGGWNPDSMAYVSITASALNIVFTILMCCAEVAGETVEGGSSFV